MTLVEAYDYIDLLLDKADQPYFTNAEKDNFLELALTEFINDYYERAGEDEDVRMSLGPITKYTSFSLTDAEILAGDDLEDKYPGGHSTQSSERGYFVFGNQYVLPEDVLHTIILRASYYNGDELDANSVADDIITGEAVVVKNVSSRDYYSTFANDPFNRKDEEHPNYNIIENRMVVSPRTFLKSFTHISIIRPSLTEVFEDTGNQSKRFLEIKQHELIQRAVRKMTANIESTNYQVQQIETEQSKSI